MTDKIQRRFGTIVNFVYLILILGLSYLFLKYCFGIVFPFIFAFFVAMIVQRPTNKIYSKVHKFKGIISTVLVLLLLLIIVTFVMLIGASIVSSVKDFVAYITKKINDFPTLIENIEAWLINALAVLPDSIENRISTPLTESLENLKELTAAEAASRIVETASTSNKLNVSSIVTPIGGGVWNVLKQIPSVLINTVITVVASCFMASDYDRLVGFLKNRVKPSHSVALSRSKSILLSNLKQLLKAYGTIMLITFAEVSLGLYLLKMIGIFKSEYVFLIAAITAIVDIVPVLGTGTIMIPWALYSFITGNYSLAIGLIIIYVVILVIRQIIEPKLVAEKLGLPPVITIAAMYIGTQLFGIIGLFLLPIILIMVKRLNDEGVIHLWSKGKKENHPQ